MILGDPWKPVTIVFTNGQSLMKVSPNDFERVNGGVMVRLKIPSGKIRFYPLSSIRYIEYEESE